MKNINLILICFLTSEIYAGALSKVESAMNQGISDLIKFSVIAATLTFVVGALYTKVNVHVGKQVMIWAVVSLGLVLSARTIINGVVSMFGGAS
jgi:hypothetical protein